MGVGQGKHVKLSGRFANRPYLGGNMRTLFIAMLSAFALVCTACASAWQTLNEIPLLPQRIFQSSYSFVPLEESF